MSNKLRPAQYADARGSIVDSRIKNITLLAEGPTGNPFSNQTVPPDGTAGFEEGALYWNRGGAAGASLYINEGTQASSLFRAFAIQSTMQGLLFPRNMFDGGDFTTNPWQRGTSQASDITNTVTYGPDRFFMVAGASSAIDWSQNADTTLAGFNQSWRVQRKAANADVTQISIGQVFESVDCIALQGQTITVSFWAKSDANYSGGKLTVSLNHSTTAGNDTAAHLVAASTNWQATPTIINATQAITSTWTRYQFTGTVPVAATQLGFLIQWTPTGTASTTDAIDFQGFQLEVGTAASQFEHHDIEMEIGRCQRYYVQINETNGALFATGVPTGSNTQSYDVYLPTTMRIPPTTVTWTVGGFKLNIDGGGSTTAPTSPSAGSQHSNTVITLTTANTLTAAAHSIGLFGTGTTGSISASADL